MSNTTTTQTLLYQSQDDTNQIQKQKMSHVTVESLRFFPKKRKNKIQNDHKFVDLTLTRQSSNKFNDDTPLTEVFDSEYKSTYYNAIREQAKKLIKKGKNNLYLVFNEELKKLFIFSDKNEIK